MSTLRVNTIQNTSGIEQYLARAWVNFNGTGTVAIRASGNVNSITDNGVGDYTVNFTNALADANYSFIGSGQTEFSVGSATQAAGSIRFSHGRYSTGNGDYSNICVAVFR
jgi:hypothetical protein